jgi:hypothetical protein
MKDPKKLQEYKNYMDNIKAPDTLRERVIARSHIQRVRMTPVYAFAAAAALVIAVGAFAVFGGFERRGFGLGEHGETGNGNIDGVSDIVSDSVSDYATNNEFSVTRSFVPTRLPNADPLCSAPGFCMCAACKGTAPTNLSESRLNTIRDQVMTWLSNYDFPVSSAYVSGWGELNGRIVFEFNRDDVEMLEMRPKIEETVWFFLKTRSDFTLATLPMETFAFIGWGEPVLVPYEPKPALNPALPQIYVHEDSITSTELTFNWVNTSNLSYTYGAGYELFVREGDYWRSLNHAMTTTLVGYPIPPNGETQPRELSWDWNRGALPAGEYRITKGFFSGRGTSLVDYEAEIRFTIE